MPIFSVKYRLNLAICSAPGSSYCRQYCMIETQPRRYDGAVSQLHIVLANSEKISAFEYGLRSVALTHQ